MYKYKYMHNDEAISIPSIQFEYTSVWRGSEAQSLISVR